MLQKKEETSFFVTYGITDPNPLGIQICGSR